MLEPFLQQRLHVWLVEAFGGRFLTPYDRVLRVLEEANELAQAAGISRETADQMVQHVYDRPEGEPLQELAGVINTVLLAAEAYGVNGLEQGALELNNAWDRIDVIRAKQKDKVMG